MDITLTSDITVTPLGQLGGDRMIASAAWLTTGKDAEQATDEEVARLIDMLVSHKHGGVFEFGCLQFDLHLPWFVIKQWQRHRVGWNYSEASGRWYRPGGVLPLQPIFWVPRTDRPYVTAEGHKPTAPRLVPPDAERHAREVHGMHLAYTGAWTIYRLMIRDGVCAEVARAVLPLATYTRCRVQANPRSLLHFLSLRTPSERGNPQHEIVEAAHACEEVLKAGWPLTHAAWVKHGRQSI